MKKNILEMRDVSFRGPDTDSVPVFGLDIVLASSELALVLIDHDHAGTVVCDLAQGLIAPKSGKVYLAGKSWDEISYPEQSAMRGLVGRVFDHRAWISNMNVYENIVLSRRFHTSLSGPEIRKEAELIAGEIGLDVISDARPDVLHDDELKLSEWIRAFIGGPRLLLLEQPESGVKWSNVEKLISLTSIRLEGGVAVLWFTRDRKIFESRSLAPSARYIMSNGEMTRLMEDENA